MQITGEMKAKRKERNKKLKPSNKKRLEDDVCAWPIVRGTPLMSQTEASKESPGR